MDIDKCVTYIYGKICSFRGIVDDNEGNDVRKTAYILYFKETLGPGEREIDLKIEIHVLKKFLTFDLVTLRKILLP